MWLLAEVSVTETNGNVTVLTDAFHRSGTGNPEMPVNFFLPDQLLQKRGILQQVGPGFFPKMPPSLLQGVSVNPLLDNCCKNGGFCNSSGRLN